MSRRYARSAVLVDRHGLPLEALAGGQSSGDASKAQALALERRRAVGCALSAERISKRFGPNQALDDVSLEVDAGEIRALLGPNGAGKTTLLRVLCGLVTPDAGTVSGLGESAGRRSRARTIGLVPSGDRTFYLRLSGHENLVFFARLHGFRRRDADRLARRALERIGLPEVGRLAVGRYSHGMQKRLSVARAVIARPPILLVDEATHDLDPEGSRRVRDLVAELAAGGTAVLWATQRLEEIRGFAREVTVLHRGRSRFDGTVPELLARSAPRAFALKLGRRGDVPPMRGVAETVAGLARVTRAEDGLATFDLVLEPDVVLGDVVVRLAGSGYDVLSCRELTSAVEDVFLELTADEAPT
jgi:ABC-2 type transport system ATP-binding protein